MSTPTKNMPKRIKTTANKRKASVLIGEETPTPVKMKGKKAATASTEKANRKEPEMLQELAHWREYNTFHESRKLLTTRFVQLSWLEPISHFVTMILKRNNLERMLDIGMVIYPVLTKAFYASLTKNEETGLVTAKLKGVEMKFSEDVWQDVLGLPSTGLLADRQNIQNTGLTYNKEEALRSMMKEPTALIGAKPSTSLLKLEWRLIHYLLTYIFVPRGTNHATIFEDDLITLWYMKEGIAVNWPAMIIEHMMKAKRNTESALPYGTLIAKILQWFKVPIGNTTCEAVKAENELTDKHLKQMGYQKTEDKWSKKGSEQTKAPAPETAETAPPTVEETNATGKGTTETHLELYQQILARIESLHDKQDQLSKNIEDVQVTQAKIIMKLNELEAANSTQVAAEEEEDEETESAAI